MKASTIAIIVGALVALYLIMRRRGPLSMQAPPPRGGLGAIPYGGAIPTTNAPGYGQPTGTSGAQDFQAIAGGITSLIGGLAQGFGALNNAGVFSSGGIGGDSGGDIGDSSWDF